MNEESDIQKFLENVSKNLGSPSDNEALAIIPPANYSEKELIDFLENSHRLFRNSFCFRQRVAYTFIRCYAKGDCLTLIFFAEHSDLALEVNLSRFEHGPSENRFFRMTSYTLDISRFNYKKTIADIRNYKLLIGGSPSPDGKPFYKECKTIFSLKFHKIHRWKWLDGLLDYLKAKLGKKRKKNKIYRLLKGLEKNMAWTADQKLVTIKF